jgi:tetratricopeptide (TPR) repeat protein
LGNWVQAIAAYQAAYERNRVTSYVVGGGLICVYLAQAYLGARQWAEASAAAQRALTLFEKVGHRWVVWARSLLYVAYALMGNVATAQCYLDETLAQARIPAAVYYHVAGFYATAAERDEALMALRHAIELEGERAGWIRRRAQSDPDLFTMRDDPEFRQLIQ